MKGGVFFLIPLLLVAAGIGIATVRYPVQSPNDQVIIWGHDCLEGGPVAFSVSLALQGSPLPTGCSEIWAVISPPSEHGDLSAEVAWVNSHPSDVSGVFLDDFFSLNSTGQAFLLDSFSSFRGTVCPVLYAFDPQPASTNGTGCVLLAIQPLAAYLYYDIVHPSSGETGKPGPTPIEIVDSSPQAWWMATIGNATAAINARSVMLLGYTVPFSGWQHPIPESYINALGNYSADHGLRLVLFE